MESVRDGTPFGLRSPKTGEVVKHVDGRSLWQKILENRLQTGEPYLIFSDTVNRAMPQHQRDLGLKVRQSNLCSEIMLHTGPDHRGQERTAVCCLSSVNAESFMEWRDHPTFIEDVYRFLDNVLQDFIDRAPPAMEPARYAAQCERSVGLGLMGFHSFLQAQNVPFESALAKSWNMRLFKHLRRESDKASRVLAEERGACPDAAEKGVMERFSHKIAIAPTASISIICGGTSAGIEPIPANIYTHKTLSGSFAVKNPYLEQVLAAKDRNTEEVWSSILENEGSVQHLDWLTQDEKDIFKTAFELDQRWIIELAADRTPEICQSQSLNVFIPGDVDKWDLHMLHYSAWERGVKSLYYLRSKSVQRAAFAGGETHAAVEAMETPKTDYEECLACQ
jgi:ribonucleoside-diphosphate reductase alpha chain